MSSFVINPYRYAVAGPLTKIVRPAECIGCAAGWKRWFGFPTNTEAGKASAVADVTADEDSTYIYFDEATTRDQYFDYTNPNLSGVSSIISVQLFIRARLVSGSPKFSHAIRANNNDWTGPITDLTSSYTTYVHTWTTNPSSGSAWTQNEVNGIGTHGIQKQGIHAENMASGFNQRATQMYIQINYT